MHPLGGHNMVLPGLSDEVCTPGSARIRLQGEKEMNNPLGCNTLYPHGRLVDAETQFDVEAHKEALAIIKDAGFDGCEFSHYDVLPPDDCLTLRVECEDLGLTPWSAHSWLPLAADEGAARERLPVLRRAMEHAVSLGVAVVVFHAEGGGLDLADPEQRHQRRLGLETSLLGLAPYSGALDVKIAIENCGDRADLGFLVEAVLELGLPNVGFNIDTGHAVLHGMAPADAIRLMGQRLYTTHLQDNFGARDDHLPPGAGSIEWGPVISALQDMQYGGTLMVEISDCPPGREPDAVNDTRTAYANLRRLVDEQMQA